MDGNQDVTAEQALEALDRLGDSARVVVGGAPVARSKALIQRFIIAHSYQGRTVSDLLSGVRGAIVGPEGVLGG